MVRFCDKEVVCVEFDKMERKELLRFFLNGHIGDVICVVDAAGGYLGMITYYSLLNNISINNAISTKHVTLDENIWGNIRHLFDRSHNEGYELIPVVDTEGQLISFAYEDADANREIRMLRELMETPKALQFKDIYPECHCVTIYEFNELAFFFAQYLKSQGIFIQVHGSLWEYVSEEFESKEFLEYQYMNIYAEGIAPKSVYWMENLLRTVSVEFECIDKIYEANIKKGIIKDADGGSATFIMKLQKVQLVAILGTGVESQDVYDYLLQEGIDICCFVVDGKGMCEDRLFGKPVLNLREVINRFGVEVAFIECFTNNSAWGAGGFGVDYFDYMGFERNKKFFCINDYMRLQGNSLKAVLKNRKVVLAGDVYLCGRLADYLGNSYKCCEKICYLKLEKNERFVKSEELTLIDAEDMDEDTLCLIVLPEYHEHPVYIDVREKCKSLEREIKEILVQKKIYNYSNYFSHMISFINLEKEIENKYPHENLRVKRMVLGSINSHNGNFFFRGLLDGHPSVMLWDEYSYLNNNLFWFCIRLANRRVEEIITLLKQIYCLEAANEQFEDGRFEKFIEGIYNLLIRGEKYTSQELFVIFHMARTYAQCKSNALYVAESKIIYWEPHFMPRKNVEKCIQWLNSDRVPCEIVNVVRDSCNVRGSLVKDTMRVNKGVAAYGAVRIDGMFEVPRDDNGKRRIVRFEDLKLNPKVELQNLCRGWRIPWSDALMRVTHQGEKVSYYNGEKNVTDFDLAPVYNKYEEYLSEFDRFRFVLLGFSWQKTYGYPYIDPLQFSRRDLQEMYLTDFRFSREIEFADEESRLLYYIGLQNYIRQSLWHLRVISWMDQFGTVKLD